MGGPPIEAAVMEPMEPLSSESWCCDLGCEGCGPPASQGLGWVCHLRSPWRSPCWPSLRPRLRLRRLSLVRSLSLDRDLLRLLPSLFLSRDLDRDFLREFLLRLLDLFLSLLLLLLLAFLVFLDFSALLLLLLFTRPKLSVLGLLFLIPTI